MSTGDGGESQGRGDDGCVGNGQGGLRQNTGQRTHALAAAGSQDHRVADSCGSKTMSRPRSGCRASEGLPETDVGLRQRLGRGRVRVMRAAFSRSVVGPFEFNEVPHGGVVEFDPNAPIIQLSRFFS